MENFAEREGTIWFNGRLVPWKEAHVHIMNQGMNYGLTVIEGERTYAGRIFRLTEHTERLIASARAMGFEIPWSRGEIELATMQVIKASNLRQGFVRVMAWPGSRYMDLLPRDNDVNLAIVVYGLTAGPDAATRARGMRVSVTRARRPHPDTHPAVAKSGASWAIGSISRQIAVRNGFDDAIMMDCDGTLAGTTGANIFLGMGDHIVTPIPQGYCSGITRRTAIDLLRHRNVTVVERSVSPSELLEAREVFITGTAAEITPITRIDDRNLLIGPNCHMAMKDYQDLVHVAGELIN